MVLHDILEMPAAAEAEEELQVERNEAESNADRRSAVPGEVCNRVEAALAQPAETKEEVVEQLLTKPASSSACIVSEKKAGEAVLHHYFIVSLLVTHLETNRSN